MRDRKMKNLEKDNIFTDEGKISIDVVKDLEKNLNIKLPKLYVDFITKHNGARINARCFDYEDPNCDGRQNSDAIVFDSAESIQHSIEILKLGEEPDWDIKYRFEDRLIPFGDNGGGDMICFDYRKHDGDNPPIVIWNHDMGFDYRVVFVANNFEEFINMLYEPEDE